MQNYIGRGDTITIMAPGDVTAGGVYQGGAGIGIYHSDALSGEMVAVWVKGEFALPAIDFGGSALDGVDWSGTQIVAAAGVPNAGVLSEDSGGIFAKVIIG